MPDSVGERLDGFAGDGGWKCGSGKMEVVRVQGILVAGQYIHIRHTLAVPGLRGHRPKSHISGAHNVAGGEGDDPVCDVLLESLAKVVGELEAVIFIDGVRDVGRRYLIMHGAPGFKAAGVGQASGVGAFSRVPRKSYCVNGGRQT